MSALNINKAVVSAEQVAPADSYLLSDIIFCLKNEDVLWQRAENESGLKSVDLIIDTAKAMSESKLTENQELVTMLRWESNMTLKEVADILGISPEAVRQSENLAKSKIQTVLDKWGACSNG